MFSPDQRSRLRSDLLEYAARDRRLSGPAITGSAAAANEDKWSDIDLADEHLSERLQETFASLCKQLI
jgi:hypothetical protein